MFVSQWWGGRSGHVGGGGVLPVGQSRPPRHTRRDTSDLRPPHLTLSGSCRSVRRFVCCYFRLRAVPGTTEEKFRAARNQTAVEHDFTPPGEGTGDAHLSVKVSSCHGYGGQADFVAAPSDPLDDVLVLHGLHRLPVDGQQQSSVHHPSCLGWTLRIDLPQNMN